MRHLLICSYLEPEHVNRIKQVSPDVKVHYYPELLPSPRYQADHIGAPFIRNEEQRARWYALLAQADILFDIDYQDLEGFKQHATSVKWIQTSSAGIGQFVKGQGLDKLGAIFTTAAGVHARPLAEFTLWGMLAFAKNYPLARKQQQQHHWQRFHGDDLEGKTLAIVGLGSVGREIARMASALGVRVIASKRQLDAPSQHDHIEALYATTDLHEMLKKADYICLICPHTPETEGMIDRAAFAAMKPEAVLINIGRGALVNEQALIEALTQRRIQGAVLDVAPQEPLDAEHPLWAMDNVIIFPHSASTSKNENRRLVDLFCDNLERFIKGQTLKNVFYIDRLY